MPESIFCRGCGEELLDRQAFREKPLCMRCRFTVATLDVNYANPVAPGAPRPFDTLDRIPTVMSEDATLSEPIVPDAYDIVVSKKRPSIVKSAKPAKTTRTTRRTLEAEGDESIAQEALKDLEEIEEKLTTPRRKKEARQ